MVTSRRISAHASADDTPADHISWLERSRRRSKPDNEVPATVAVDVVLGETEDYVVFLSAMSVYSTGVDFTLELRARRSEDDEDGGGWGLGDALHGRGGSGVLLGVEYADGRRGFNLGGWGADDSGDDRVELRPGGGGGGDLAASSDMFLSPLPPDGPLRLVCAWPDKQIAETVTTIDGALIVEAAGRVRELWPMEPLRMRPAHRHRGPELPAGGWFAELEADYQDELGADDED